MILAAFPSRSIKPPAFVGVPALRQVCRYNLTANRTLLGRYLRVHLPEDDPGTLCLGSESQQEADPGNLTDRLGQSVFPDDVGVTQPFDRDSFFGVTMAPSINDPRGGWPFYTSV